MAFWFQGFFASASDEQSARQLMEAVLSRWPAAVTRPIEHPFFGIGVCLPQDSRIEAELSAWSTRYPQTTFVYLNAVCFGGLCDYGGSVYRAGELLLTEAAEAEDGAVEVLQDLLEPLGVTLDDRGYFAPFERGFFDVEEHPT